LIFAEGVAIEWGGHGGGDCSRGVGSWLQAVRGFEDIAEEVEEMLIIGNVD